jgi:plasmid stabilization system protein ParE
VKSVQVLAAARRDIESERNYYNRTQPGLGSRFSRAVAKALRNIRSNPEAMQVIEQGIRRWPVEHFPHGIMYSIEELEIVVISVFHPLQDPSKWKRRI